ncbi:MAG: GlsB/YeaQ/YmgE family stress response membrane protein [Pseudomonadota bacterium]
MFNIIGWIIIGFLTGLLARFFYPGAVDMGWIWTTVLGIAGSFVGGFIGGMFTKEKDMMRPTPAGFIMSVIGAMVLIFIVHRLGIR